MHTQWFTDVTVTNPDSQTSKKQKTLAKKHWSKKYIKIFVIKALTDEWQNLNHFQ